MFYIFSCCYNSRTIQYIKFKFEALLSYTKTIKCVKFQGVWCTGVRVGVFRISPIASLFPWPLLLSKRFIERQMKFDRNQIPKLINCLEENNIASLVVSFFFSTTLINAIMH